MHRIVTTTAIAVLVALGTLVPGPAWADSVTVQGTSSGGEPTDITKMVVNNRDGSVLVKVFGDGGKNRSTSARIARTQGRGRHRVRGSRRLVPGRRCGAKSLSTGAATWSTCDGLVFTWEGDGDYWKIVVPRSCLKGLADRIKAKSELVSYAGASPGYTPWSPWVQRG